MLVLVQSDPAPPEKTTEKYSELSERKIILNLRLGEAQSLVFLPLSPGRAFVSTFTFTLQFSLRFPGTRAGFTSRHRYYLENNKQAIFSFRCLQLSLTFHYQHIQPARSTHSTTSKELQVELSGSRILLWI